MRLARLLPGILVKEEEVYRGTDNHINFIAQMIRNARKYFFSLSGECNHILWEREEIIDALDEAIKREINICIACGPQYDISSKRLATLFYKGDITFFKLNTREDSHHFQVNDAYDVAYHKGNEDDPTTRIYCNSPFIRNRFVDHFLNKISGLVPVKRGDFLERFRAMDIDEERFISIACEIDLNNNGIRRCSKTPATKEQIDLFKGDVIKMALRNAA